MRLDLLHYELSPDAIAQAPREDRLSARLLDLPAQGEASHRHVGDLPALLPEGALVVVNDTRVIPARLLGKKRGSGGKAEIFLVRQASAGEALERWWAMGRASKGLKPGSIVDFEGLSCAVEGREEELLLVRLEATPGAGSVREAIARAGHVPLPPYIRRDDTTADRHDYQTIFARVEGAVAAPTAGLHLTEELVSRIVARGCAVVPVTLHVGLGTFQSVNVTDLDDHRMHAEVFDVPVATAEAIAQARARGVAVVAIGTTVVRALEAAADPEREGYVRAGGGETRLLIQPGFRFRVVDRLFTNFHLPGSTLLALVSAFAGRERILAAYQDAQARGYRFFSYGDAMFLEPSPDAHREAR